jgi:3-hydroxy-9,10-secoandrosta-1,3,5(10)-triene-9,17-dione monooxygenase reductase component
VTETGIGPQEFKNTMARVAATVTVVTATTPDGPIGLTVSAFTSVSADPQIVLVCIDKRVGSLQPLLEADGYTVNLLPEGTDEEAMIFATHDVDRFAAVSWHKSSTRIAGPVLDIAFGHFECEIVDRVEMGDHWVIFGRVLAGGRDGSNIPPLVWLGRGFVKVS